MHTYPPPSPRHLHTNADIILYTHIHKPVRTHTHTLTERKKSHLEIWLHHVIYHIITIPCLPFAKVLMKNLKSGWSPGLYTPQ